MRQQHELSKAFPPMSDEEFADLKYSIEVIGVQTPIVIYEGKVLDGWHRYTAAMELGMDCPELELGENIDPRDFVLANNKSRRHLNKSQLALSYTKVYEWRPSKNLNSGGELSSSQKTNQELAEMAGTSKRTIQQAKVVLTKGDQSVVEAVEKGAISVKRGAQIARLPKDKQGKAITESPEPKPSILDGNEPSEEELKANEMAMQADLDALNKLLEADDALAVAHAEIKRLNYAVAQKEVRIAAIMKEKSECIKLCKSLQAQLDKIYRNKK